MNRRLQQTVLMVGAVALFSLVVAACGGGSSSSSSSSSSSESSAGTTASNQEGGGGGSAPTCGGSGGKATGSPIVLGALVTKQPSLDFTPITDAAKAYFDCVNENGGINGRPIKYLVETDQSNPQQVASNATKLIENDHVLAMVGGNSLLDCGVNQKLYEEKGFNVIAVGSAQECYSAPNIAPVNGGPYYSQVSIAKFMVDHEKVNKLVAVAQNQPGFALNNKGAVEYAESKGVDGEEVLENVPISDPTSVALKLAESAGPEGGVILEFSPEDAVAILQAAEQQGLIEKTHWGCAAPCNDNSVAEALGSSWDGKLAVNSEFNLVNAEGPELDEYRAVIEQYAPQLSLSSYTQFGAFSAQVITSVLRELKPNELTVPGVNKAILDVKKFESEFLCKPWYFGKLPAHIPDETMRTVTPSEGELEEIGGCEALPALPSNPLAQVRKEAKAQGLG